MPKTLIAKKSADQYMLRLPKGLRQRLQQRADESGRSINTEIVDAIEKHLAQPEKFAELERRVARMEAMFPSLRRSAS